MMWDATRYGWSPVYYLTIEGLPIIWTEQALGLTLPTDYTSEAACLVLEDAAIGTEQIDRQRGVSMSPPLQFKLLDCATVTDYLTRWSAETRLTQTADFNDAILTVESTTDFTVTNQLFLGRELITFGPKTGTEFHTLVRGVAGWPYTHKPGTSGQTVTDKPRYWRGRQVTLWAKPCDQGGAVPGTALATDAVEVWRGRITGGPSRQRDGFSFSAEQLDRALDAPLSGRLTGKVVAIGGKYVVDTADTYSLKIEALDAASVVLFSYVATIPLWSGSGKSNGNLVTGADIRKAITDSWALWTADFTLGEFGALTWYQATSAPIWRSAIALVSDPAICSATVSAFEPANAQPILAQWPGGMVTVADATLSTGWNCDDNPLDPEGKAWGVTVEFDDILTADLPQFGLLRVKIKSQPNGSQFAFSVSASAGKSAYLGGKLSSIAFPMGDPSTLNAECEVVTTGEDTYGDLMLTALQTSGFGARGFYDTGLTGFGYGLDEDLIDIESFTDDDTVQFDGIAIYDGGGFADIFGGVLGLFRRAVVLRVDNGAALLALISTDPGGSPNADTITDADLLAHQGDPVESIERALAPNSIRLVMPHDADGKELPVVLNSSADIEATGRREVEYRIQAIDRLALKKRATSLSYGLFAADQTAQALKITVGPWIAAQVGDVVYLDGLTHPAIWSYVTGTAGYTGTGRVVGRTLNPVTQRVTLTLLIDGAIKVTALCPSALVTSHTGTVGAPTNLYIGGQYLDVMQAALAAGSPCKLMHYKPGYAESTTETYTFTGAAASGVDTVLTGIVTAGGHSIVDNVSYVTFPTTVAGSTMQDGFAHVDDGGSWG